MLDLVTPIQETKAYQSIFAEGEAAGRAAAKAQVRAEGKAEGKAESLKLLLRGCEQFDSATTSVTGPRPIGS